MIVLMILNRAVINSRDQREQPAPLLNVQHQQKAVPSLPDTVLILVVRVVPSSVKPSVQLALRASAQTELQPQAHRAGEDSNANRVVKTSLLIRDQATASLTASPPKSSTQSAAEDKTLTIEAKPSAWIHVLPRVAELVPVTAINRAKRWRMELHVVLRPAVS